MNVYIFKCSDGTYKIGKADDITRRKPQVEKQFNISAERPYCLHSLFVKRVRVGL